MKHLKQAVKNKISEKKTEIILDAAHLVEEQQTALQNHSRQNRISGLEICKNQTVKNVIRFFLQQRIV